MWNLLAAQGVSWAAVKCSEGTSYANPYDAADVGGATAAGLEVCEYHFAHPAANTAANEATWCIGCRGPVIQTRQYALDLEDGAQLGWMALAQWCRNFVALVPLNLIYVDGTYRAGLTPYGFP